MQSDPHEPMAHPQKRRITPQLVSVATRPAPSTAFANAQTAVGPPAAKPEQVLSLREDSAWAAQNLGPGRHMFLDLSKNNYLNYKKEGSRFWTYKLLESALQAEHRTFLALQSVLAAGGEYVGAPRKPPLRDLDGSEAAVGSVLASFG